MSKEAEEMQLYVSLELLKFIEGYVTRKVPYDTKKKDLSLEQQVQALSEGVDLLTPLFFKVYAKLSSESLGEESQKILKALMNTSDTKSVEPDK